MIITSKVFKQFLLHDDLDYIALPFPKSPDGVPKAFLLYELFVKADLLPRYKFVILKGNTLKNRVKRITYDRYCSNTGEWI